MKGQGWDLVDARCYRVKASGDFDGVMLDFQTPTPLMMKYWFDPSKPKEESDPWRPDSLETMIIATSEAAAELAGDFNRTGIKRILGTQAPNVNNGQPVTGTLTLQPFDAIILLADYISSR